MTRFISRVKLKKLFWTACAAVFWLAVWQFCYLRLARDLLLVSPVQAFARLFELSRQPSFWISVIMTCLRVLAGFSLALVTGCVLAPLCARFKALDTLVSPILGVIRATPVVSFIILALLWFKTDRLPVFIAFLMVAPMVFANLSAGIREIDAGLLEMAKIFRLSRFKIFSAIYVPSLMPYFVSACSVGLGFAWRSAIAAEVICLPKASIGKQIYSAKIYLETADVFAWTITVILLSLVIEKLAVYGLKRLSLMLSNGRGEVKPNA